MNMRLNVMRTGHLPSFDADIRRPGPIYSVCVPETPHPDHERDVVAMWDREQGPEHRAIPELFELVIDEVY
ncbi:hypothetical protein L6R52_11135 [Myxococcota bacterium]|nr:hypothetical protein [Myxococcota bacterium]